MIPLASLCSPSRGHASGGRLSKGGPPRARLCAPNPLCACPSGHLAPIASYTRPSAAYVQEPVADSEHLGTAALILDASPLACSPEGGQNARRIAGRVSCLQPGLGKRPSASARISRCTWYESRDALTPGPCRRRTTRR